MNTRLSSLFIFTCLIAISYLFFKTSDWIYLLPFLLFYPPALLQALLPVIEKYSFSSNPQLEQIFKDHKFIRMSYCLKGRDQKIHLPIMVDIFSYIVILSLLFLGLTQLTSTTTVFCSLTILIGFLIVAYVDITRYIYGQYFMQPSNEQYNSLLLQQEQYLASKSKKAPQNS